MFTETLTHSASAGYFPATYSPFAQSGAVMPEVAPRRETGFTAIDNDVLDAMLLFPFSERQYRVLLTLIRKINGYRKERDDISGSQIGDMCDMPRSHVSDVLNQLAAMRVIFKERGRFGTLIEINKNFRMWLNPGRSKASAPAQSRSLHHYTYRVWHPMTGEFYLGVRSCACQPLQDRYKGVGSWAKRVKTTELHKEVLAVFASIEEAALALQENIRFAIDNPLLRNEVVDLRPVALATNPPMPRPATAEASNEALAPSTESVAVVQNVGAAVTESVQVDRTESVHTKENLPKENKQKKKPCASPAMLGGFERFYSAYPKKKSRALAEKAFAKIAPDETLLSTMLAAITCAKQSAQWANPQMIPYPASWLNARSWEDDIQTAYSPDELTVIETFNAILGGRLGLIDANVFVESRAGAIRHFLSFSKKPNWLTVYFSYINTDCELPPRAGFDWLLKLETFAKVREEHFQKGKT